MHQVSSSLTDASSYTHHPLTQNPSTTIYNTHSAPFRLSTPKTLKSASPGSGILYACQDVKKSVSIVLLLLLPFSRALNKTHSPGQLATTYGPVYKQQGAGINPSMAYTRVALRPGTDVRLGRATVIPTHADCDYEPLNTLQTSHQHLSSFLITKPAQFQTLAVFLTSVPALNRALDASTHDEQATSVRHPEKLGELFTMFPSIHSGCSGTEEVPFVGFRKVMQAEDRY
jgi:hypothetical protein